MEPCAIAKAIMKFSILQPVEFVLDLIVTLSLPYEKQAEESEK